MFLSSLGERRPRGQRRKSRPVAEADGTLRRNPEVESEALVLVPWNRAGEGALGNPDPWFPAKRRGTDYRVGRTSRSRHGLLPHRMPRCGAVLMKLAVWLESGGDVPRLYSPDFQGVKAPTDGGWCGGIRSEGGKKGGGSTLGGGEVNITVSKGAVRKASWIGCTHARLRSRAGAGIGGNASADQAALVQKLWREG